MVIMMVIIIKANPNASDEEGDESDEASSGEGEELRKTGKKNI